MSTTDDSPHPIDPAVLRGLTEERLSRRTLLRSAGGGAAVLGLAPLLAACGISGTQSSAKKAQGTDWPAWWKKQKPTQKLVFANWPYYIDTTNDGKHHPSLEQFTKKTGIDVKYLEVIQNNAPFYAKIAPELQAGQGTGYDIIVLTNGWQLTELINNAWLIPLDFSRLPNFKQYAAPAIKSPAYDPGNHYTVVWQSGFTGIGYNPKLTKREITSLDDLFDPAFKGHIGMMSDNTELGSVGLLRMGIDPPKSTPSDWQKAADMLTKQRPLVRQYYDQSYINALENGDTWITQAWSGDVFQANLKGYKDLKFILPKEGAMGWHDNMMIPMHAANPVSALEWMNFSYDPKIAAEIADWNNYVTPVPSAQPIVLHKLGDPTVGHSPMVFPTAADYAKVHDYYVFKNYGDFQHWNHTFDPIIQS